MQSVGALACSDEYLQVLGLTQPTVVTLELIRGLFLVSPSASVVNLLLTIPQRIPSGTFSVKIHVKSQYSRYKRYYKTPQGQFFIQMMRERTGGDSISAIVQRAFKSDSSR